MYFTKKEKKIYLILPLIVSFVLSFIWLVWLSYAYKNNLTTSLTVSPFVLITILLAPIFIMQRVLFNKQKTKKETLIRELGIPRQAFFCDSLQLCSANSPERWVAQSIVDKELSLLYKDYLEIVRKRGTQDWEAENIDQQLQEISELVDYFGLYTSLPDNYEAHATLVSIMYKKNGYYSHVCIPHDLKTIGLNDSYAKKHIVNTIINLAIEVCREGDRFLDRKLYYTFREIAFRYSSHVLDTKIATVAAMKKLDTSQEDIFLKSLYK